MQVVKKQVHGGMQCVVRFKNNKGASILKCPISEGWPNKWELVRLRFTGKSMDDWEVVANSMKVLTDKQLAAELQRIKEVKK